MCLRGGGSRLPVEACATGDVVYCSRPMIANRMVLIGCVGMLGVAGCGGSSGAGGGGTGSLKLGAVVSLARPGDSTKVFKAYKYKTAIVSVKQAGANDLKGETLLGDANKNDVAFYVTQRVTGVQADYSGWTPETADVYDSSGSQATPLVSGTDLPHCVEHKPPAGFGAGQSFETCDVYLLPPGKHAGKVVLAAEGPGENDLTWTIS